MDCSLSGIPLLWRHIPGQEASRKGIPDDDEPKIRVSANSFGICRVENLDLLAQGRIYFRATRGQALPLKETTRIGEH